ncbi:hypothetical protein AKJ16_DCAP02775, partial [Drosera capensis]
MNLQSLSLLTWRTKPYPPPTFTPSLPEPTLILSLSRSLTPLAAGTRETEEREERDETGEELERRGEGDAVGDTEEEVGEENDNVNLDALARLGPRWCGTKELPERLAKALSVRFPTMDFKPAYLQTIRLLVIRRRQVYKPKPMDEGEMEKVFKRAKEEQEKADKASEDELKGLPEPQKSSPDTPPSINGVIEAVKEPKPKTRSKRTSNKSGTKLRLGTKVEVVSGTFADVSGIIKKLDAKKRKGLAF